MFIGYLGWGRIVSQIGCGSWMHNNPRYCMWGGMSMIHLDHYSIRFRILPSSRQFSASAESATWFCFMPNLSVPSYQSASYGKRWVSGGCPVGRHRSSSRLCNRTKIAGENAASMNDIGETVCKIESEKRDSGAHVRTSCLHAEERPELADYSRCNGSWQDISPAHESRSPTRILPIKATELVSLDIGLWHTHLDLTFVHPLKRYRRTGPR